MTRTILPGHVVVLDEIDATTGDRWTGYVIETGDPLRAVRCWRGAADLRTVQPPLEIIDTYPAPSRDLRRASEDIAASIARAPRHRHITIARTAARLDELATLRLDAELDAARDRQRDRVAEFNAKLEQRRAEWAPRRDTWDTGR